MRLCLADPDRADQAVIDAGTELTTYRDTQPEIDAGFLGAARSLLDGVGHTPQLETSDRVLEIVTPWLGRLP